MPKGGKKAIDKKQDKRIVKLEKAVNAGITYKHLNLAGQTSGLASAGGFLLVNGLTEGALEAQRTGQKVTNKFFKMTLQMNSFTVSYGGDGFNQVRVMLVMDKTPARNTLALGDLFQSSANDSDRYYSQINPYTKNRFHVYYDKKHTLNMGAWNSTAGTSMKVSKIIHIAKNIKENSVYQENSNVGTITDIQKGALFLGIFGPTAATVAYNLNSQFTYIC